MKKPNDTIGNRTRDLPACSAVPQPTAPPRAPSTRKTKHISLKYCNSGAWGGGADVLKLIEQI